MRLPNFFIIGAPKCGTTSVARWLAEHPQVYFSANKEPHFFNLDGHRRVRRLEDYEALFKQAKPKHIAIGEGSTHYLYSRCAVPSICDYQPDARFIVCIRNPVDMVASFHGQRVRDGSEPVTDCESAWRLQDARSRGLDIPRRAKQDLARFQYGRYCSLGEQLDRLYQVVPRTRVLVILLDDLRYNPAQEYKRALDFLSLEFDSREHYPVENEYKAVRSLRMAAFMRAFVAGKRAVGMESASKIGRRIRRWNFKEAPRPSLRYGFRAELVEYFRNDIGRLEVLLGKDLSPWLESRAVSTGGTWSDLGGC